MNRAHIRNKLLGMTAVLIGLLGFSIMAFFSYRSIISRAAPSTQKVTQSSLSHGTPGDLTSDIVLGQVDFNQASHNQVVAFKVSNPGGVIVDRLSSPNTVYVYDGGNSRILGYTSLGACANDANKKCTTNSDCPGSSCSLTKNRPADFVLGQPSATGYNGCNGDANMQNYPLRKPASASTLCTLPEMLISPLEGGSFANMVVDRDHNLYVTDFYNNRVLKYTDPVMTDAVADDVWGQSDFSGNRCNLTDSDLSTGSPPYPTATSLCMGRNAQWQESFTAGVELDNSGNLWVADSSNHRVLRFPFQSGTIAKTADLVLGQPSFTTRVAGNALNQLNQPSAVRVDQTTGWVYVADYANHRILIFKPPFVSGMSAQATFGSQLKYPAGLAFDPAGSGLWVSDYGNSMMELWDMAGLTALKVLFKDTYQPNGQCGTTTVNPTCINPGPGGSCSYNMCGALGSLGIDSDSNLFISSSSFNQDAWRFAAPISTPSQGRVYASDYQLFSPPDGHNYFSAYGLFSPRGIVVKNNQLIVSDGYRLLFWNDPQSLTNGKPADGYAGVNSFQDKDPWTINRIAADNNNRLWVAHQANVDVYQLPLTSGAKPIKTVISYSNGLPVLGGGTISWGFGDQFWGIDVDPSGNYLWLTQVEPYHRVLRVRNPFTNPMVDVILGQTSPTGTACNRNLPAPQPDTVCYPGAVKLDHEGNVWVSDHSLEFHGNKRMLMFDKALFDSITTSALFAPAATLVSPTVAAWEPAFSSTNAMAVGFNSWLQSGFPGIYLTPKSTLGTTATPDMTLKDVFSHGYSATFDEFDNLYIADLNRGRILFYNTPLPLPTPTPTPTPNPNYCPGPNGSRCEYTVCTPCTGRLCPKNPCRERIGVCRSNVCKPR